MERHNSIRSSSNSESKRNSTVSRKQPWGSKMRLLKVPMTANEMELKTAITSGKIQMSLLKQVGAKRDAREKFKAK